MRWVQQDSNEACVANLWYGMAAPLIRVVLLSRGRPRPLRGDTSVHYVPTFHGSTDGTVEGVLTTVSWLRLSSESAQFPALRRLQSVHPEAFIHVLALLFRTIFSRARKKVLVDSCFSYLPIESILPTHNDEKDAKFGPRSSGENTRPQLQ